MDDLNDLYLFANVVECRGFSAASRKLGVPKSRLSRRLALLEAQLGVRLLQRSSRSLQVTAVGQLFYERCQAVVSLSRAAREAVQDALAQPQGLVRVSCPVTLAQVWLTPLLPRFLAAHPKVRVALLPTNRRIDPLEESVDVLLRVRRPPFEDSSLVVRTLGTVVDMLVASPHLAARCAVDEPGQLAGQPTLSLPSGGGRQTWRLRRGTALVEVAHEPRLMTDDMLALRQAAIDGLGIALLPEIVCGPDIEAGRLQVVLPGWATAPGEVQVAFPSRRGMPPAVRALIDFLAAHQPGPPAAAGAAP